MLILDRNEKLRGNMEWLSVAVIQHKRCTRIKDAVEISMGMLGMKKDKDQGYSKLERIINPCLQKKKNVYRCSDPPLQYLHQRT